MKKGGIEEQGMEGLGNRGWREREGRKRGEGRRENEGARESEELIDRGRERMVCMCTV